MLVAARATARSVSIGTGTQGTRLSVRGLCRVITGYRQYAAMETVVMEVPAAFLAASSAGVINARRTDPLTKMPRFSRHFFALRAAPLNLRSRDV